MAPAWKSSAEAAAAQAAALMPSGAVQWGLDPDETVFSAYGVPYQPWTVLIVDGVEVNRWPGALAEGELRANIESMLALTG